MRYYGAAYYPEVVSPEEWDADLARMAGCGMNVVRLAEGSWAHLEPEEGRFTFDWLDEVLALCRRHGIAAVLATPTFTPPAWLARAYPDTLPRRADGRVMGLGGRQHYCPHSAHFLAATRRIVRAMAERFGDNPAVIGWQIHNEFGMETCYCDRCAAAWQIWLRARYGTIDALNEAWGMRCWGQMYPDFDGIALPATAVEPGEGPFPLPIILAHRRFRSDDIRAYQQVQVEELRGRVGARFLTHNAMGLDLGYDHYDLFADLDVASWDNYPPVMGGWTRTAMGHGITRGLRPRPHWVMEQLCGGIGDGRTATAGQPAAGAVARWVLHSYAHGAEAVLYWLWRSLPAGNWSYWQGLLTPGGHVTGRYDEARQVGERLRALRAGAAGREHEAGVEGANKVAVVLGYDDWWALDWDHGAPDFSVAATLDPFYEALAHLGLSADVLSPRADLTRYALVIVPALSLCDRAVAENLARYARGGGIVVAPPRTGRYTWEGTLALDLAPGPQAELCGLRVRDYDVLLDGRTVGVADAAEANTSPTVRGRWWCDFIEIMGAETIATYSDGRFQGQPAITWNACGDGGAFYLGTYLDSHGALDLLTRAIRMAGVATSWQLPPGCEVATAHGITFIFNHTAEEKVIRVPDRLAGLGDTAIQGGSVTLAPNDVAVTWGAT